MPLIFIDTESLGLWIHELLFLFSRSAFVILPDGEVVLSVVK